MANTSRTRPDFTNALMAPDMLATAFDTADNDLKNVLQAITADTGTGIVSTVNPTAENSPLWVAAVTDKNMYWDVYPGTAVTVSGKFLTTTNTTRVPLVDISDGAENLIIIKSVTSPLEHYVLSSTGDVVDAGEIESCEVGCMTYSEYLNLQATATTDTYDTLNIDDIVVLGVVTWDASAGPALYTTASTRYPWLRPWFTAVDVEHRSKIGTGTVSDTNPHGQSLADLQIGGTTIYEHLTSSGMIYSKDYSTIGIPGVYCYQRFLSDAIKLDTTGEVTSDSIYGGLNAKYVVLSNFPNTITSVRKVNNKREMCGGMVPRSNIFVFSRQETIDDTIDIWYFKTDSLTVSSVASTSLTLATMQNSDLAITGGQALSSVGNTTLQFRRYGSIPRSLTALISTTGKLFPDPYVLVQSTLVTDVSGENQTNEIELYAPAILGVGVSSFAATQSAYLAIRLYGTDANGAAIKETLEFKGSAVTEAPVGSTVESATQVLFTQQTFYALTSWEVVTTASMAPTNLNFGCALTIYAKTDLASSKLASAVSAHWTGNSIINARDARRILPIVTDGEYGLTPITQAAESIGLASQVNSITLNKVPAQLICAEDFRQPKYINITKCAWRGNKLQSPVITSIHATSTNVVECYKSRFIPALMSETYMFQICVVLFGNDVLADTGSVRCTIRAWTDTEYETILKPYTGDANKRTYLCYANIPARAVAFTISGTANGFAAYLMQNSNPDTQYYTTLTPTGI